MISWAFSHKMYFALMTGGANAEETKMALIPLMEPMKDQDKLLSKVWRRIMRQGTSIGQQTVYAALLMFFAFRRKGIPIYARSIIIGALGYFLALFDAIPDLSPVVGYTDDLGVLSFGLVTIAAYINDDVRVKARKALSKLFTVDLDILRPIDDKL